MVAMISFEGAALDWFRSNEEREPFKDWKELKDRLLVRFRSSRKELVCGQFLVIKQETMMEECRNLFDKLVALLPQLSNLVLEETFMNGLICWIKT